MDKLDLRQPDSGPAMPLWTQARLHATVLRARWLPLRWTLALSRLRYRVSLVGRGGRKQRLAADMRTLRRLAANVVSDRELFRQAMLSRAIHRTSGYSHARVHGRSRAWLQRSLQPEGLAGLEEIRRSGQGAIVASVHFGLFRWVAPVLLQLGCPLRILHRRKSPPEDVLLLRRGGWLDRTVPFPQAGEEGLHLKWLCELIRRGQWVQHVVDFPDRQTGLAGRFLGQPIRCCRGPWVLARLTGAPVLAVLGLVDEGLRPRLIVGPTIHVPAGPPPREAMEAALQTYLDFLAAHAARRPWNLLASNWNDVFEQVSPPAQRVAEPVSV